MEPIVKKQILAVKHTGETNMFDVAMVAKIAVKKGYYELVEYLQEHKRDYTHFIIWGREPEPNEVGWQGEQSRSRDSGKQDGLKKEEAGRAVKKR